MAIPVLEPITSSWLDAAGFDADAGVLYVRFKHGDTAGPVWSYGSSTRKVPEVLFSALRRSKSPGNYFNTYIGKVYPAQMVGEAPVAPTTPVNWPQLDKGDLAVASPLYLALLETRKACQKHPNLLYQLWVSCGKESRGPETRYVRCLDLIQEGSGVGVVGLEYLDAAIALARERKI